MKSTCKNCGLPIEQIVDPWGYAEFNGKPYGWHHPTVEREANIDGVDLHVYATFCPEDMGEAEPLEVA
jgi:hypothetical protein